MWRQLPSRFLFALFVTTTAAANSAKWCSKEISRNLYKANFYGTELIIIYHLFYFLTQNIPLRIHRFTLDFSLSAFRSLAVTVSSLSWAWTWRLSKVCRGRNSMYHYKSKYKSSVRVQHERCHCIIASPISSSWKETVASCWICTRA